MTRPATDHSNNEREIRLRFMRIDRKTGDALREFWPAVEKALPRILEGFYAHVGSAPALAKLIGDQSARLKTAQGTHWARLFNGKFDEAYIQGVRTIGLVHNKIGLEPRWYIGGYAFVLSHLTDLAIATYGWRKRRLAEVITAVNSAVMLDMDFAISVYQEAMLEDRAKRQRAVDGLIAAFEGTATSALAALSSSSGELKSTADSMGQTSEQTKQQAVSVASASEEASVNVQTVASASEEMASSVNEIARQVNESAAIAQAAVDLANKADARVHSLSGAASKIGDVVDLISTIAGQTNLLALNATIEAARAGEAGRGFAVVASEVKSLAEQTAKATSEISQHVSGIQTATQESVENIKEISGIIGRISEISTVIASAVEEQGAATQEIARNVQEAAKGTSDVSANIEAVSKAANETAAASAQVLAASSHVAKQGELLSAEVERFLQGIRAA
ncbi:MAG TPA: globin-coupled sensor protein [Bradyrhizobium sp.]|uniref:globin-coupled sensor protein n=1 Tax=Bradyrhizobium sp. TaxID=376 RepID=UPI002D7EB5FC|nr:globin-coupled sensor protein [Bradyrhizobium sp.]HET7888091.1 globin-coupled sensor protein [Bradyrhizobium sp.]